MRIAQLVNIQCVKSWVARLIFRSFIVGEHQWRRFPPKFMIKTRPSPSTSFRVYLNLFYRVRCDMEFRNRILGQLRATHNSFNIQAWFVQNGYLRLPLSLIDSCRTKLTDLWCFFSFDIRKNHRSAIPFIAQNFRARFLMTSLSLRSLTTELHVPSA